MSYKQNKFKEFFDNEFVVIGIAFLCVLAMFIYGTVHHTQPPLSEVQTAQARQLWYKNASLRAELEHRHVKRLADYLEQYHLYRKGCGYVQGNKTWFESEQQFEEFVKLAEWHEESNSSITPADCLFEKVKGIK